MPLFLCRWENGDFSVVQANNRGDALYMLDEVGNAEGSQIKVISEFMIHLKLADDGEFQFEDLGEAAGETIYRNAYPILDKAQRKAPRDERGNLTPEGQAMIKKAVRAERNRVKSKRVKAPSTEAGKALKAEADMPTVIVDRIIRDSATRILKDYKFPKTKN